MPAKNPKITTKNAVKVVGLILDIPDAEITAADRQGWVPARIRLVMPGLHHSPMFTRLHHQAIAQVLYALNGDLLREYACLFGGGTVIAMRYGEYRESVEIDFLVSSRTGYRELRQLARNGLGALFRDSNLPFAPLRDVRIDQYGIRSMLEAYGNAILDDLVTGWKIAANGWSAAWKPWR